MRSPRFKFLRVFAVLAVVASMVGAFAPSLIAAPASQSDAPRAQAQSAEVCVALLDAGIIGADGELLGIRRVRERLKVEGLHAERVGASLRLLAVTDADDPERPAALFAAGLDDRLSR